VQATAPASSPGSLTPELAASLVGRVAASADRQAFAALYRHFGPRLKAYCLRQRIAPDLAEELVQETMVALWRKAASFDPAKAAVSTWLFTIIRNKRIDRIRRENRPEFTADDMMLITSAPASAEESVSADNDSERLSAALATLPAEQQAVMVKAFFEDKSHSDIAAETGLPLGTVKSRIRLALSRLKILVTE
jgi:RNA polymerase sigma-70 factor, ECF subfamily